jgi:hypothetical protein
MTTENGGSIVATFGAALVNKINATAANPKITAMTSNPGSVGTPVAASAGYRGLFLLSVDSVTYGVTLFDTAQHADQVKAAVTSWWGVKVDPAVVQPSQACTAWLDPDARMVWTVVPSLPDENGQRAELVDATSHE